MTAALVTVPVLFKEISTVGSNVPALSGSLKARAKDAVLSEVWAKDPLVTAFLVIMSVGTRLSMVNKADTTDAAIGPFPATSLMVGPTVIPMSPSPVIPLMVKVKF